MSMSKEMFVNCLHDHEFLSEKKNNMFSISVVKDRSNAIHEDYSKILSKNSPDPKDLDLSAAVTFNGGQLNGVAMFGGPNVDTKTGEAKVDFYDLKSNSKQLDYLYSEMNNHGLLDSFQEQMSKATEDFYRDDNKND